MSSGFGYGAGELKALSTPPTFATTLEEREYIKSILVAAARVLASKGMDRGVVRFYHIQLSSGSHDERTPALEDA